MAMFFSRFYGFLRLKIQRIISTFARDSIIGGEGLKSLEKDMAFAGS